MAASKQAQSLKPASGCALGMKNTSRLYFLYIYVNSSLPQQQELCHTICLRGLALAEFFPFFYCILFKERRAKLIYHLDIFLWRFILNSSAQQGTELAHRVQTAVCILNAATLCVTAKAKRIYKRASSANVSGHVGPSLQNGSCTLQGEAAQWLNPRVTPQYSRPALCSGQLDPIF